MVLLETDTPDPYEASYEYTPVPLFPLIVLFVIRAPPPSNGGICHIRHPLTNTPCPPLALIVLLSMRRGSLAMETSIPPQSLPLIVVVVITTGIGSGVGLGVGVSDGTGDGVKVGVVDGVLVTRGVLVGNGGSVGIGMQDATAIPNPATITKIKSALGNSSLRCLRL